MVSVFCCRGNGTGEGANSPETPCKTVLINYTKIIPVSQEDWTSLFIFFARPSKSCLALLVFQPLLVGLGLMKKEEKGKLDRFTDTEAILRLPYHRITIYLL